MITNYQNATTEIEEIRHRVFVYASDENAGYSFEVDANGDLLKPTALIRENFAKCEAAVANGEMLDHGIEIYRNSYRIPASGSCECGERIYLNGDTECACGRKYNVFGQELRSFRDDYYGDDIFDD